MLAHHYHPRTRLHIKIYVTIHKAIIPADTQTQSCQKPWKTLEGIKVSALVGEVCCCVSGEAFPLEPLLSFIQHLTVLSVSVLPSQWGTTSWPPAIPGEVRWASGGGRWKQKRKRERETSTGQERGFSPGQSISEPLWSHKKNCSKSCTLASISIRRLHIASMQSHIVTWYHIQSCRLITQLTLEMDRSKAQEIDLANILPSCLPTSLLSKFMVKIFFYFVAPMLGLRQRLFSLFITLSVSLSMRILQQRQLDLW